MFPTFQILNVKQLKLAEVISEVTIFTVWCFLLSRSFCDLLSKPRFWKHIATSVGSKHPEKLEGGNDCVRKAMRINWRELFAWLDLVFAAWAVDWSVHNPGDKADCLKEEELTKKQTASTIHRPWAEPVNALRWMFESYICTQPSQEVAFSQYTLY